MNDMRTCTVKGKICYFHGWTCTATSVASKAIVEFPDGTVQECCLNELKFCDSKHMLLAALNKGLEGT